MKDSIQYDRDGNPGHFYRNKAGGIFFVKEGENNPYKNSKRIKISNRYVITLKHIKFITK